MHINWYGQGLVGIKTKNNKILIDPPTDPKVKLRFPKTDKDSISLISEFAAASKFKNLSGHAIDSPGEYEISGIFIYGKEASEDYPKIIYSLHIGGVSIAHLGGISESPSEEILNEISETDILFIPVGGNGVLTASKAAKLINQIEPSIIIPIYYKEEKTENNFDSLDKFVKEIGIKPQDEGDKVIIKKRDISEEVQLIVINP